MSATYFINFILKTYFLMVLILILNIVYDAIFVGSRYAIGKILMCPSIKTSKGAILFHPHA